MTCRSNGAEALVLPQWLRGRSPLFLCLGLAWSMTALASDDFLSLPLEDLLKIEITSASRKVQKVQEVAAAVFVISHEDIERSGARSIPEALRLAPGVEVARLGNSNWAVSIRGFNGRFSNKLLVLKDGRNVYSPLYSGVLWEAEDTLLGDIERIEVIRGPNAAMWGANAVNGVINIISRHAAETQGTEVVASTGTDEAGSVSLRHGFQIGDGYVRLSAKGFDQSPFKTTSGEPGNDRWTSQRIGLRGDWSAHDGGNWMLVGEAYNTRADNRLDLSTFGAPGVLKDIYQTNVGSNLLLKREQPMADGGTLDWQISAEDTTLDLYTFIHEERQTITGEFQRRSPLGRHELLWGASYRYARDNIILPASAIPPGTTFDRPQRDSEIASVFIRDEYALIPDRLKLSGGVRLGHDSWSGAQVQPDIRLAWMPDTSTTWWSSLSRAARTPSRLELDGPYAVGPNVVRLPPPQDTLKAEIVTSLEAGFRHRVNAQLSVDLVAFVSDYSSLVSMVTLAPVQVAPTLFMLPLTSNNDASARTHGLELAADWQVSPTWRIQPNYTQLFLSSPRLSDPAAAAMQDQMVGRVARHRASLRSSWKLRDGSLLDLWLKYTSALGDPQVPAYSTLDLRYAFRIGQQAELAFVGQNLLDQRHLEFISDNLPAQQTEVGRSLMIKGTWHF